nr:pyrBI operon leader peptide [Enterobacter hormaechei]
MVKRVRHIVLPRLKSDAGLPFFFPLLNLFPRAPHLRGFFLPGVRR